MFQIQTDKTATDAVAVPEDVGASRRTSRKVMRGASVLALLACLHANPLAATRPVAAQPHAVILPLSHIETQGPAGQAIAQDLTLDWRTPELELVFDLPPAEIVDEMSLRLLGDPLPGGTRATTIELTYNDGEPMPLSLDARGFTATIPLPARDLRSRTNIVRLRLVSPHGDCLTAADGGWDLDLSRSRVDAVARPRSRAAFLSEIERLLAQSTDGPRTLSIRAYGDEAHSHEALAAQGLALRTPVVPKFVLGRQAGDLSVMVGTRAALAGVVTDPVIVEGSGPRLIVHEGRPLRLVVTGDTTDEVRAAIDAFATHHLPRSNRRVTSPDEMDILRPLDHDRRVADGRMRVHKLGGLGFSDNWGAGADQLSFTVSDPQASSARVKLDLRREDFIAPVSSVSLSLNGRDLGTTVLDAKKVGVDIRVPQGWLRGSNQLTVTPDLVPSSGGCAPAVAQAGVSVGTRSFVEVTREVESSDADLSKLSAGAGIFTDNQGAGTHVALPSGRIDREAALRMLSRVAISHGAGLTRASYGETDREGADLMAFGTLPESVRGPRVMDDVRRERGRGVGVAAFPDGDRWVAQFAPQRGTTLSAAADVLTGPGWDDLSGGVARMDSDSAEMVKTAYATQTAPVQEGRKLAELSLPKVTLPELSIPAISMPEFQLPATGTTGDLPTDIRQSYETSVATLSESWARVEIVDAELVAKLRSPFSRQRLRGRFDAPRAMRFEAYLDQPRERIAAGFLPSIKRWERKAERRAAELRKSTGLPQAKPVVWKWGDRHMSLAAMLVMLAFGVSMWFLTSSAPVATWRK